MLNLKPCPICGNSELKHMKLLNEDTRPSLNTVDVIIDCGECGCSMTRRHLASDVTAHDEVVKEWNRRENYSLVNGVMAPCPFCASECDEPRFVSIVSPLMTPTTSALISCPACPCEFGVTGIAETEGYKDAFIATWNKRHGKKAAAPKIIKKPVLKMPVVQADQLALFN